MEGGLRIPFFKLTRMKRRKEIIIGLALMPIFYTLFMLDRGVMLFCPHIEHKSIKDWAGNNQLMLQSFTRVIVVGLVLGVLQLCIWTYHILFNEL